MKQILKSELNLALSDLASDLDRIEIDGFVGSRSEECCSCSAACCMLMPAVDCRLSAVGWILRYCSVDDE